jgi:hypothetical protein
MGPITREQMTQHESIIRKLKAKEALLIAKIIGAQSIDEIHALTSNDILDFLKQNHIPEANKLILEIVYKQLELLRFDEFKDKSLADWKRVRSAIEHENTLVNHRLTWLLSSQAFLFTGFGVIYSGNNNLYSLMILAVIGMLGIAISFKIFVDIENAGKQLWRLDQWWHETHSYAKYKEQPYVPNQTNIDRRLVAYQKLGKYHPELQFMQKRKLFWLDKGVKLEIAFITAWVVILSVVVAKPFIRLLHEVKYENSDGWFVMPILIYVLLILAWRSNYLKRR